MGLIYKSSKSDETTNRYVLEVALISIIEFADFLLIYYLFSVQCLNAGKATIFKIVYEFLSMKFESFYLSSALRIDMGNMLLQ